MPGWYVCRPNADDKAEWTEVPTDLAPQFPLLADDVIAPTVPDMTNRVETTVDAELVRVDVTSPTLGGGESVTDIQAEAYMDFPSGQTTGPAIVIDGAYTLTFSPVDTAGPVTGWLESKSTGGTPSSNQSHLDGLKLQVQSHTTTAALAKLGALYANVITDATSATFDMGTFDSGTFDDPTAGFFDTTVAAATATATAAGVPPTGVVVTTAAAQAAATAAGQIPGTLVRTAAVQAAAVAAGQLPGTRISPAAAQAALIATAGLPGQAITTNGAQAAATATGQLPGLQVSPAVAQAMAVAVAQPAAPPGAVVEAATASLGTAFVELPGTTVRVEGAQAAAVAAPAVPASMTVRVNAATAAVVATANAPVEPGPPPVSNARPFVGKPAVRQPSVPSAGWRWID